MNKRQLNINTTSTKLFNKNQPVISPKPYKARKNEARACLPPTPANHTSNEQKSTFVFKSLSDSTRPTPATVHHFDQSKNLHHESDGLSDKKMQVEQSHHSENIKRLKDKFEKEFESKVINSLISPSEKKSFFSKQNQFNNNFIACQNKGSYQKGNNFRNQSDILKTKKLLQNNKLVQPQFDASDIPLPCRNSVDDVDLIDFTDLPPPPDLMRLSPKSDDKQLVHSNNNSKPKERAQPYETSITLHKVSDQTSEKKFPMESCSSLLNSQLQTQSLTSNRVMQSNVKRELEQVKTIMAPSSKETLVPLNAEFHDTSQLKSDFDEDVPKETVSNNGMKTRNLDEEILYYEHMDIMEKIKEKQNEDHRHFRQTKSTIVKEIKKQSSFSRKKNCQVSANELSAVCSKSTQGMQAKPNINRQTSKNTPAIEYQVEFQNAVDDLEYEFLKLKEKLQLESDRQIPPKIPPKKLKFSHHQVRQAFHAESSLLSPVTGTQTDPSDVFDQSLPPVSNHKRYSGMLVSIEEQDLPVGLMQSANTQVSNAQSQTYAPNTCMGLTPMFKQQPHTSSEQLIHHSDMRANELLMQPLAPIMEEDLDSSASTSPDPKCNRFDFEVDGSVQSSCHLEKYLECKKEKALSHRENTFAVKMNNEAERKPFVEHETKLEGVFTSTSLTSTTSFSSSEDASDTSSIQWEYNPMKANFQGRKILSSSLLRNHSVSRPLPALPTAEKLHSNQNNDLDKSKVSKAVGLEITHLPGRITQNEQRTKKNLHHKAFNSIQTSEGSKSSRQKEDKNGQDVVKPYETLDLSKLHPSFEKDKYFESRPVSTCLEPEVTPSSIMYNITQFNAFMSSMPKTPTKSTCFTFMGENDCLDVPHFPLNIHIDKTQRKTRFERTASSSSSQEPKLEEKQDINWEEMKYDNLEKYGAFKKEVEKTRLRKASLSPNYLQSVPIQENLQAAHDKEGKVDSQQTLNLQSKNCLLSTLEKSHRIERHKNPQISEPLLARHSSAVRAVDQHKEKQKRLKECEKLKSSVSEKASFQEISQKSLSFTLPRAYSKKTSKNWKPNSSAQSSISTENIKSLKVTDRDFYGVKRTNKPFDKTSDFNFAEECPHNKKSTDNVSKYLPTRKLSKHKNYTDFDSTRIRSFSPTGNFVEYLSDDVTNTYEEVQEIKSQNLNDAERNSDILKEDQNFQPKVEEVLENIQLPKGSYKPKVPLPRYPVEYDNFYPRNSSETEFIPSTSSAPNQAVTNIRDTLAKSVEDQSVYEDIADTAVNGISVRNSHSSKSSEHETQQSLPNTSSTGRAEDVIKVPQTDLKLSKRTPGVFFTRTKLQNKRISGKSVDESSCSSFDSHPNKSLANQHRVLPCGNSESKSSTSSYRQENSSLELTESAVKQAHHIPLRWNIVPVQTEEETLSSKALFHSSRKETTKKNRKSRRSTIQGVKSDSQMLYEKEDHSIEQSIVTEAKHLTEANMPVTKWRRSKSQDGLSPKRSKSKERPIRERRPKSQERPTVQNFQTQDVVNRKNDEVIKSNANEKQKDRKKLKERTQDGHLSGGRGKSPVKFFKKLLKNKKEDSEEDDYIVHVPLGKGENLSDSTEALTTILAYKGDDVFERESWTPPRPNPPRQKFISHDKSSSRPNKAKRSPFTHRSKKVRSILASTLSRGDFNSGSSSEGLDQNQKELPQTSDVYGNMGSNRSLLAPAVKPIRSRSRKNSFSSSLPSSDSEQLHKSQEIRKSAIKVKRGTYLFNREYDSDSTISAFPSDQGSSVGTSSDIDNHHHGLRSAMKGSSMSKLKGELFGVPKRPVRVISPKKSKSDPMIFSEDEFKNTYYNVEGSKYLKSSTLIVEKKSLSKPTLTKKYQKETVSPELAYETHRGRKYKTFVTLNAQTLRKVTDQILTEWENQSTSEACNIMSWSDVVLSNHQPLCVIGSSAIYSVVAAKNNAFKGACQLYAHKNMNDQSLRRLEKWKALPMHPNVCGVCNHFPCRIPVSLVDIDSGDDLIDARCVILNNRPFQPLQQFLNEIAAKKESTEFHRQVLINILQLLQGIEHLDSYSIDFSRINPEHLFIVEDRKYLQYLPHPDNPTATIKTSSGLDLVLKAYQSSDSDSGNSATHERFSIIREVGSLMKSFLQTGNLILSSNVHNQTVARDVTTLPLPKIVLPGTKYSTAIKCLINYFTQSPPVEIKKAINATQCALWGPEDIDDIGVDDVSSYSAMELWIETQQVQLVNNLAVLSSNDRQKPSMFFKHKYFASVVPDDVFNGLMVLQRC